MPEIGRMVREEYSNLLPDGQKGEGGRGEAMGRTVRLGSLILTVLVGFQITLSGCSLGDGPHPPPPEEFLVFSGATDVRVAPEGRGLTHYSIENSNEPWAIQLLRVDLSTCDLGLQVLEAPVANGEGPGRTTVSALMSGRQGEVVAGVNGDFFTPEGLPVGTEVVGGETRRVRGRPALAWKPHNDPWVGIPRVEGDSELVVGWSVPRIEGDGLTEVIGGFPLLLQAGARVGDLEVSQRASFAAERHPRTAVGFDSDSELLWVVVVDGRQPDHSMGMTLPELTALFETLGVEEAINLDGGGSSVMVVGGAVVSHPSDAEGERPVVNALGIVRDPGFCSSSDQG
jgi:hypothetical protein